MGGRPLGQRTEFLKVRDATGSVRRSHLSFDERSLFREAKGDCLRRLNSQVECDGSPESIPESHRQFASRVVSPLENRVVEAMLLTGSAKLPLGRCWGKVPSGRSGSAGTSPSRKDRILRFSLDGALRLTLARRSDLFSSGSTFFEGLNSVTQEFHRIGAFEELSEELVSGRWLRGGAGVADRIDFQGGWL